MNIGIDIDDTISNTIEETYPLVENYIRDVLKREVTVNDFSNISDYDYIESMLSVSPEEMEKFWKLHLVHLIKSVKPKEDAINIINQLKKEEHRIIIITARWNEDYCNSDLLSRQWLEKYGIQYDKLYTGADSKKEIAVNEKLDLFIDDSIKNCREVSNENIKTYLFESKLNVLNKKYKEFETVNSWKQIYQKINEGGF